MVKACVENFDRTYYATAEISELGTTYVGGDKVHVAGSMSIKRHVKNDNTFLIITMTKQKSIVGATIFSNSPIFEELSKYDGKRINGSIYGTVAINGKYTNINVANIEYFVEDAVDPNKLKTGESDIYRELVDYIEEINDPYLRQIVRDVYDNEKIINRFLTVPATEYTSYSYLGGLAANTLDLCNMVCHLYGNVDMRDYLKGDFDLIMSAALLCNIGRAFLFDVNSDGTFYKNEYNVLDTDTALTRDVVKASMRNVSAMVNDRTEDPEPLYKPKNSTVCKELLHILDTYKSLIGFQNGNSPRTRSASIFASVVSLVNAVAMFNKIEASNVNNERLVKAYDGGKLFFIPPENT